LRVEFEPVRYCLMATYLWGARISEVIGRVCPTDQTVARGPKANEVKLEKFQVAEYEFECAVWKLKTAKRSGKERYIALPLDEKYEPWTKPLYGYFARQGDNQVWPFTRQYVWQYVKDNKVFSGFTYPIEKYSVKDAVTLVKKEIPSHNRNFMLHALRHLRATELVEVYGFDAFNLCVYFGWTMKSAIGISGVIDRYVSLSWQSYFTKLLKKTVMTQPSRLPMQEALMLT